MSIERPWSGSIGLWVNRCGVGVDVMWNGEGGCESQPGKKYTCSSYVAPEAKTGATLKGRIEWVECESPGGLGDVIALERPDGSTYCWGDPSPRERVDMVRRRERESQEIQRLRVQIENKRNAQAQRLRADKERRARGQERQRRERDQQRQRLAARASGPCSTALSPACHDLSMRGVDFLSTLPSRFQDPASLAYCSALVGIETNSYCARQLNAIGRSDCGRLSQQQAQAYRQVLPQMETALDAGTRHRLRSACRVGN